MTSASVSEPGEAPSVNLAAILTESAAHSPEALALKLDETELSYAALDQLSARFAGLLRDRGIAAGERILLISPNLPQMPVAYYGALRHGSVVVPLNPLLKSREIEYHLKDSEASLVVVWEGVLAEAAPAAAEVDVPVLSIDADFLGLLQATEPEVDIAFVTAQQTAVILYTSGTTGRPKGAELTHANLLHQRADHPGPLRPRRRRRHLRRPAVLPYLRPDLRAQCRDPLRRHGHPAAAVRSGAGPANHSAGPSHDLPGRAHDVHRATTSFRP